MRYKCICSYDGTNFYGFQTQLNLRTIQEEIEKVLLIINKQPITIYPSGRTDSGVHALGQVFHFDSDILMENWMMKNAINSRLPKDIYISLVEQVTDDFHSRFDAKSKEYHYLIDIGEFDPLKRNYRYYCPFKNLDIGRFKDALKIFVGVHDFRSFTKNQALTNTVREIYSIDLDADESLITIKIVGEGFMRHMVRILVAMALEVGRGKLTLDELKSILAQKNRQLSPKIVPASGLYLYKVNY